MFTLKILRSTLLGITLLGIGVLVALAADPPNKYYPLYWGECTWYAAERRADLRFNTGYAYEWGDASRAQGFMVDTTPEVGAVAVWAQGKGGASACCGHVAYVISVTDASNFRVAEYNWNAYHEYDERDVTLEDGIQFIHGKSAPPPLPDPNVAYSYSFNPNTPTVGARVQITVGASDNAGQRAVNAIDVLVDGAVVGTIARASGSVTWDTNGAAAGSHQIGFRARLAGWSGNVNTRYVNLVLQAPSPASAPSSGPDPWDTSWLPSDRSRIIGAIETIITSSETGGSANAGLKGYGEAILNYSLASVEGNPAGVNPAFALAMFRKEANFATYGAAPANKNPGNIVCAGGTRPLYGATSCSGRFGVYPNMDSGIKAYFWLLQAEYKPGGSISRNCPDIPCIIRAYAPSSENNTALYISQVSDWTRDFQNRISNGAPPPPPPPPPPTRPDAPALVAPGNGSNWQTNAEIVLRWNSSANATQYKVEVWGGSYSTMTPCDWQSGTSCHIGTMWPGTMSWHVKARNASGQESDWSDTWAFTIQSDITITPTVTRTPPASGAGRPTLTSPSNGASLAQSTSVTLNWIGASNALQYKVELWGGPYSTMVPCDWQSWTSCQIGTMRPGTMSWHVKARNASGQEGDWSDTWSFTIQGDITITPTPTWTLTPQPLSVNRPTLSSPRDGASMLQSTDVTLYWNTASNATQYKVEVWGGPYSTMTPCNWQGSTSCHIGTMWPGTMSWHVKARNNGGQESDWSDTWSFTIQGDITITPTPTATRVVTPGRLILVDGLSLSSTNVQVNQSVNARFRVRNDGGQAITVRFFGVKGRHSSGATYDFLWIENKTFQPGEEFQYDVNRSFDRAGLYSLTPNYSPDGSNWSDLKFASGSTSYATLAVASAPPSPTFTPTRQTTPGRLVLIQGLSVSLSSASVNQNVNAKFRVKNDGGQPITIRFFGVKGRHSSGASYDFLWIENKTFQPGEEFQYDVNRSFDRTGSYSLTPNYSPDGSNWSDIKWSNGSTSYVTINIR